MNVRAKYGAITSIHDICEPWVHAWSGDEWGESMGALLRATHTDYGLSDEDCAKVAEILLRNVIEQHDWMVTEGYSYECSSPEADAEAAREAAQQRDYWLKGGNLGDFGTTSEDAKSSIDQMPAWMFGEESPA